MNKLRVWIANQLVSIAFKIRPVSQSENLKQSRKENAAMGYGIRNIK